MRTKLYLLAPLAGLLLFAVAFTLWSRHDRVARAEREAAERAELETIRAAEEAARREAFAEAIAAAEKRRAERAERETRRQADEAARRQALETRDTLAVQIASSERRLAELNTALENERDAVARLRRDADALAAGQKSLADLSAQATANQSAITALLRRMTAAPAAGR